MIFRYKIKFISDIEQKIRKLLVNIAVTPFVGVWIEIYLENWIARKVKSLPSWECGLKFTAVKKKATKKKSHSLRGSVD